MKVIVIGGGPAGSAVSIVLRKEGLDVTRISKPFEDQFKVGESLPAAALRLIRKLGFKNIAELLNGNYYLECLTTLSSWNSDDWSYKDSIMNPEGNGWQIDRIAFENALTNECMKLGTVIINGTLNNIAEDISSVAQNRYMIKFHNAKTEKIENIYGDWIIDATGRNFSSAKYLDIGRRRFDRQIAIVCWVRSPDNAVENSIRIKSTCGGWWYSTCLPHGKRVIVFHGLGKKIVTLMKDPLKFVQACNESRLLDSKINPEDLLSKPFVTSANVSKAEKCAKDYWLAVGDAALSFDPLSSQGIFFALYTGIKAAEVIIESCKLPSQKDELTRRYSDIVNKIFEENQIARSYYYNSETRFDSSEYWSAMQSASGYENHSTRSEFTKQFSN
jgi:flavin-dependent dehydrogenase